MLDVDLRAGDTAAVASPSSSHISSVVLRCCGTAEKVDEQSVWVSGIWTTGLAATGLLLPAGLTVTGLPIGTVFVGATGIPIMAALCLAT